MTTKTTRREFLQSSTAAAAALALPAAGLAQSDSAKQSDRPNILFILADDMGFSDIGPYGSEIATPNLDTLAKGGLKFTQFYNNPRCCPSRASLLTGLYSQQAGMGLMTADYGRYPYPGYRGDLSPDCVTIAEALRTGGYRTAISGKWHLTPNKPDFPKDNWPLQRGFDKFFGTIEGAGSYYDPASLSRDNEHIPAGDITSTTRTRSPKTPAATSTSSRKITSPSSCTPRSPRRTGRCRFPKPTSPGTRIVIKAAGTSCAVRATSASSLWASSTRSGG